jgi:hypothetical protein
MLRAALAAALAMISGAAFAQDTSEAVTSADGSSMGTLISEGYEIKAAVPNGKRFVVFLQKDNEGYACEMANLTSSQCGKIK